MISDAQITFIPNGGNQSMVAAAGVSIPSVGIIDLMGSGVGTAPPNIIGAVSVWGEDFGVGGRRRPELAMAVGTAFVTANSATLNVAMQAAADTGVAGGYQPSTWNTIYETGAITAANLIAGQPLLRGPILPAFPQTLRPRFLRLLFQIPAATNFTAGTIAYALFTWVRDDYAIKNQPKNFVVA